MPGGSRCRTILPVIAALAAFLFSTGCASGKLVQRSISDSRSELTVVGDIRTVMEGRAGDNRLWRVPTDLLRVGLGTGTLTGEASGQGTMLLIDGNALVESFDGSGVTRSQSAVSSTYTVGVQPRFSPAGTYTLSGGSDGRTLDDIYADLVARHGRFLFVVGVAEFPELAGRHLTRPPTGGESLLANGGAGYFRSVRLSGREAVFAAVVHGEPARLTGSELRVLIDPPGAPRGDRRVTQGAYGIMTPGGPEVDPSNPVNLAARIESVGELLPHSRIRNARLAVYQIEGLDRR